MEAVNARVDQLAATQTEHGEQLATISQQLIALNQLMQQIADQQAANSNPAAPPQSATVTEDPSPESAHVAEQPTPQDQPQNSIIKDLALPKFDGKQANYAFFKYQLEAYFDLRADVRDDSTRIKMVVTACFERGAKAYIASLITRNALPTSWAALLQLLDTRFGSRDDEEALFSKLVRLRQGTNTVDAYTDNFYTLYSQLSIEESTAMLQYKLGLHPVLATRLRSWQHQPKSLEDLVSAIKSLEDLPQDNAYRPNVNNNTKDKHKPGQRRNNSHSNPHKDTDLAGTSTTTQDQHKVNNSTPKDHSSGFKGKRFNAITTQDEPTLEAQPKN